MTQKILVTYASRGGSTVGVAEAIGKTLRENGFEVDVCPMQAVHDLTPYWAVVAGSAIQQEKWLPEAIQFMERHHQELAKKPFAAFLVCLALALNSKTLRERAKDTVKTWLQPIRDLANPMQEGFFAGVLDPAKAPNIIYWLLAQAGIMIGFWSKGDHRDWDAIHAWARDLSIKLAAEAGSESKQDIFQMA